MRVIGGDVHVRHEEKKPMPSNGAHAGVKCSPSISRQKRSKWDKRTLEYQISFNNTFPYSQQHSRIELQVLLSRHCN